MRAGRRRRASAVLASGAALAALAGCSGTPQLNPKGEAAYLRVLVVKAYPALAGHVKAIKCPGGFPPRQGEPYKCQITSTDGSTAHVQGTQLDDQGHLGSVRLIK